MIIIKDNSMGGLPSFYETLNLRFQSLIGLTDNS